MRSTLLAILILASAGFSSEIDPLKSEVHRWKALHIRKKDKDLRVPMLTGTARDFSFFGIDVVIEYMRATHSDQTHDLEELIIVKSGHVIVELKNQSKLLGPGSIALILPGELHSIETADNEPATYYSLQYQSRSKELPERGDRGGGSLVIGWDDVPFKPHEHGGVRSFFERGTNMCERFEMHATTLNQGQPSHPPHTHRAAEIILILEGTTTMQIGDRNEKAVAGDLVFLESEVLHGIVNSGDDAATYFAFQFQ